MKNFKKLVLSALLILLIGMMVGCSDSSSSDSEGKEDSGDSSNGSEEEYVLNLTHVVPETHATHLGAVDFKETVEEMSDGRIKIEIYPNGQLYASEREAIESTVLGNVDLTFIGAPALASFDSQFTVLDLPYLFSSREQAHEALDGELGDTLDEVIAEMGVTNLGWGESGFKNMITNFGPMYAPEDFEGKTLRVMENKLFQDTFELLGAKANPHAFGELYTALQQGVFDGADQPISLTASNKFHEVAPHYTLTEHVYAAAATLINTGKLNELPDDLQQVLIEAGEKVFEGSYRELAHEQDTKLLEELVADGMEVYEVTPEQKAALKEATSPVYDMHEGSIGKELIELAKSFGN